MNKKIIFSVVAALVLMFTGCSTTQSTQTTSASQEQKIGNTTLEGTVTGAAGKYFLSVPGEPTVQIDSYTVKFENYVSKKVKVTGQYSGDTLYVDKVE